MTLHPCPIAWASAPSGKGAESKSTAKNLLGNIRTTLGYVPRWQTYVRCSRSNAYINVSPAKEKGLVLKCLSHMATAGPNVFEYHSILPHYIGMLS
jgi:hypothetical protein